MIQSDFHIFQRDWNHQPDVKYQSKTWPSFRATKTSHVSRATWSWKSKAVNLQLGMVSISPISGKSVEVVEMVWSLGFTTSLLHYFYIRTSSVGHFLVFCFLVRSHISSVSAASVALRSCLSSHSWWMSHCLHPCHGHHLNRYFFTFVPVLFWPTNQLSVPQHWNSPKLVGGFNMLRHFPANLRDGIPTEFYILSVSTQLYLGYFGILWQQSFTYFFWESVEASTSLQGIGSARAKVMFTQELTGAREDRVWP